MRSNISAGLETEGSGSNTLADSSNQLAFSQACSDGGWSLVNPRVAENWVMTAAIGTTGPLRGWKFTHVSTQ